MNPEILASIVSRLGTVISTRRDAVSGLFAAAALLERAQLAEGKKKKHRKRKRPKSKKGKNNWGAIGKSAHVALGAYVPRALYDESAFNDFTKTIGRTPDYLVWYEDWANGNFGRNHENQLATIDSRNLTPVIAWDPFDADGPTVDQPAYRLSTIYGGNHNGYIDSWTNGLRDFGGPVFINFAHEMNGGWFPWGVGVNGNTRDDFVRAWRHVRDRFESRGADNVRWIWVPNVDYDTIPASLEEVYPGHGYVDWLGMNGYNWGTSVYWESCPCRSKWESFSDVFRDTYQQLTAIASKPIMIGETASSEKGGNKGHWITSTLINELPNNYPQVRAVTWFHEKATGLDTNRNGKVVPTAKVDWRITSSKVAKKAFRQAVRNEYYWDSLRTIG